MIINDLVVYYMQKKRPDHTGKGQQDFLENGLLDTPKEKQSSFKL